MVIATYNRGEILSEAAESVLAQSLTDLELIIVDDCSIDNTQMVINNLCKRDKRIKGLRTGRNCGCNIAYNLGIDKANGKYIAILDDDDIALPNRLQRQIDIFNNMREVGLVGSAVQYFDEKGPYPFTFPSQSIIKRFPKTCERAFEDIYLGKYIIPNPSIMVHSELGKRVRYCPLRGIGSDVVLLLQLAALGIKFHMIPEVLVLMRRGKTHQQMTRNFEDVHVGRTNRIHYIRQWLVENQIDQFDHLHKKAIRNNDSNYYLDLASNKGILGGFPIYLKAFAKNPSFVSFRSKHLFAQFIAKRLMQLHRK